ncbi:MAG TPA: adenosylhomocysteinase, partial [Phycisphaerales bacterium]|nr:adenosylhomocysteinase [Phycisphaerales bacterium]
DDGGDATMMVHKGVQFEAAGSVPDSSTTDNAEFKVVLEALSALQHELPGHWTKTAPNIKGVTEETTTG